MTPLVILSTRRPLCRRNVTRYPEAAIVNAAIREVLSLGYEPADIHLEYTLGPGCRVDIAVILPNAVLLVECKGVKVLRADVAQAERYLAAARLRWPDRLIRIVLTAPDRDERIVERDDLIVARIAA